MIDGIYLYRLIQSMKDDLIGSRIEKIYHPKEKLLIFKIKGTKLELNKLVISIDPNFCSIHLSSISLLNPDQPTSFCMLLRKHLESGIITNISQLGYERIIELTIESYNELGMKTKKTLQIELMGKYSNVILTENEIITDAIYKYPIGVNGFREILPKRKYILPPLNDKLTLDQKNIEQLIIQIKKEQSQDLSLSNYLQKYLQGFSNKSMNDLLLSIGFKDLILADLNEEHIIELKSGLEKYRNSLNTKNLDLVHQTDSLFNKFYFNKEIVARKQKLLSIVKKQIKKLEKKAYIYRDKISQDKDSGLLRIKGELLSANLYRINKKLPFIDLENYYDPEMPLIHIELNEALSPTMNVKHYFKKYHKVKEGKKQSENLLLEVNNELTYFNSIEVSINNCTAIEDLMEINDELQVLGLIPKNPKSKKVNKNLNYLKFELENGDMIYVGKNNKQNDYLTFKFASNKDLWFHRQDYPGAHVILKSVAEPTLESIELAARHAGYSGSDESLDGVTVDYTIVRNVKRHPSQKLGLAIYTDFTSIFIKRNIFN
ncbi:MAG: Fibronectin-binding A domain-containing protein [Fusobacteria bacterium]|nr:MAG: Fibronectin-binding A domain-containing protein [Fusobacteriota bacterium]KAF0229794.1 MAG: Fibronectin-binding A domain-containing [Fusobacteriota bacterium]